MTGDKLKERTTERNERELKKKIDKILRKELDEMMIDYNIIYVIKGRLIAGDIDTDALKEALLT